MHDYLFSSELVRFAFVFGIVISMVLYERMHLTTGSIVVPGYIAIFLIHPLVIIATFANSFLSYFLMNKVIRRKFLLYGRTKFTVMAMISISIQAVMLKVSPQGHWLWEKRVPLFVGVGYVVPALIAHDMGRQGVVRTTRAVLLAGVLVATPIAVALLLNLPGVNDLAPLSGFGSMAIVSRWVPLAVLLSAAASWAVTTNYGLKSGGFVGAAYIGMFMGDPYQVAIAFTVALVSFVFVRTVLMRWLILFGRRKFSAMLLTSSLISWTLMWTGTRLFTSTITSHLDLASLALTPLFVPGLLANDMDRTSPLRVVLGVALAAGFVVPSTWWVQSLVEGRRLHIGWRVMAATLFLVVFVKQFKQLGTWLLARVRPPVERVPDHPTIPVHAHVDDPVQAAIARDTERAENDAFSLHTWSAKGLDGWRTKYPDLVAEAEQWLDDQIVNAQPSTTTSAGSSLL